MQQEYTTEGTMPMQNRRYKEKLGDVKNKHHSTSLHMYSQEGSNSNNNIPNQNFNPNHNHNHNSNLNPIMNISEKKIAILRIRKQELEGENKLMKDRISRAVSRPRPRGMSEHQAKRRASLSFVGTKESSHRYDKIQVESDFGDGENIKCVVAGNRNKIKYNSMSKPYNYKALLFNQPQTPTNPQPLFSPSNPSQPQSSTTDLHQIFPQSQMPIYAPKLRQLLRQSTANTTNQQSLYSAPQKQCHHRLVLYKKTKIPFPMVSYLIEISLIEKQLLINAYGMGAVTQDLRLLLSRKRTKLVLEQIQGNYELLWERVAVDFGGIRILGVGGGEEDQPSQMSAQKEKSVQQKRHQITQDFLHRNYYTLLKEPQKIKEKEKEKEKEKQHQEKQKTQQFKQPIGVNFSNSGSKLRPLFRHRIDYQKDWMKNPNTEGTDENSQEMQKIKDSKQKHNDKLMNITEKSMEKDTDKSQKLGEDKITKLEPVQTKQQKQKINNPNNKEQQKKKTQKINSEKSQMKNSSHINHIEKQCENKRKKTTLVGEQKKNISTHNLENYSQQFQEDNFIIQDHDRGQQEKQEHQGQQVEVQEGEGEEQVYEDEFLSEECNQENQIQEVEQASMSAQQHKQTNKSKLNQKSNNHQISNNSSIADYEMEFESNSSQKITNNNNLNNNNTNNNNKGNASISNRSAKKKTIKNESIVEENLIDEQFKQVQSMDEYVQEFDN